MIYLEQLTFSPLSIYYYSNYMYRFIIIDRLSVVEVIFKFK